MNELPKTVVAMSGGVDSSVAALLLHQQGYPVLGVSMQVWDYRQHGGCSSRASCCAPDDFTDARKVAGVIGVPYYVFDFEQTFREEVIDNFVRQYQIGQTPNPCVDCNSKVKFSSLRQRAKSLGCELVATGHYAKISSSSNGYRLMRGDDLDKDQSYFLYGMKHEELIKTLFPIGSLCKKDVRELARQAGLVTAEKPESQDICFVSGSVQDFLLKRGLQSERGKITLADGTVMGEHDGIHNFTVGQRRGLQVGGQDQRLYVLSLDVATNQVIVGPKEALYRQEFYVSSLNWVAPEFQDKNFCLFKGQTLSCRAQLRHRHKAVLVNIRMLQPDILLASFEDEWTTVTPGQAAVFYSLDDCEVFGGGRITRSPS